MKKDIPALYGSLVFNDKVMRNKLPKDVYKALKKTIENGTHLELEVANSVAVAMKEWAVENGSHPFYTLVPAYDRVYCRETRQLHFSNLKRRSDHGFFRKRTGKR